MPSRYSLPIAPRVFFRFQDQRGGLRRPAVPVKGHKGKECGGDFPGFSRPEIFDMTVLLSRTLFPSVFIAYPASIRSADLHKVPALVCARFGLTICEIEP